MNDEKDEPDFDPGPPRDLIFAADLDPEDVPEVLAYLEAAGQEVTDG